MTEQPERFPLDEPIPVVPDTRTVKDGDIPLPPPEMWDDFDNHAIPAAASAPSAASPARSAEKETARLVFTGTAAWSKEVPLDFPFEWEGRVIDTITVRRLTTAEMGEVVTRAGGGFDQWDVFAAMTGLPAAVLLGLEAGDGDMVTEVAWDFLPRALRKSD